MMNILDLEEAHGLTAQAVREYLERDRAWWLTETNPAGRTYQRTNNTDAPTMWVRDDGQNLEGCILTLARFDRRTPQAILREMVKRWAPFPTPRTIQAHDHNHGGRWLRRREHDAQVIIDIVSLDGGSDGLPPNLRASSRYWPIDEDGNRVPMPYGGKL